MRCVILDGYTVSGKDLNWAVITKLATLSFFPRSKPEEIAANIGDAEYVLTSKCVIDRAVMNACPNLKYIGVFATGYNNVDIMAAREKGIAVTNVPAYSTASVAQITIALLLEIVNHVAQHSDAVHAGAWAASEDFSFSLTPQVELAGKTLGIVGYGAIGKRVAQIARALGMNVLVDTNHPPESGMDGEGIRFVEADVLLTQADVLSLHCPLSEGNRHIISKASIGFMKDGVIILNTARGPLINEADLAEALRSGKVAAADIDVLENEPPAADNPLTGLPNCIITPHIAWSSRAARERLIHITYMNLEAYQRGESLNRIV